MGQPQDLFLLNLSKQDGGADKIKSWIKENLDKPCSIKEFLTSKKYVSDRNHCASDLS